MQEYSFSAGLGLLAVIRTYRKEKRVESTRVPIVGFMNDLPSSSADVINDYYDMLGI